MGYSSARWRSVTKRRQPELTARRRLQPRTRCGSALSAPFLPRLAREVNTSPFHQLDDHPGSMSPQRRIFAPNPPNFLCVYSTNLNQRKSNRCVRLSLGLPRPSALIPRTSSDRPAVYSSLQVVSRGRRLQLVQLTVYDWGTRPTACTSPTYGPSAQSAPSAHHS